jgi:hypothetical protein
MVAVPAPAGRQPAPAVDAQRRRRLPVERRLAELGDSVPMLAKSGPSLVTMPPG